MLDAAQALAPALVLVAAIVAGYTWGRWDERAAARRLRSTARAAIATRQSFYRSARWN